jgi:glyoxylate/hydroxypyruvate reductase
MKKVLMTLRIPEHIQARLSSECRITCPKTIYPMPRAELLDLIAGHDALFCTSDDTIDMELFDQAGIQLKTVCTMSAGYNHINVAEARTRNIALGHTPDVLTDSGAEINVALVLSCLRGVVSAANSVTNGDWEKQNMRVKNLFGGLGESLVGNTVGFLGLGRIGLATAQRLLPFKIGTVYYSNRQESPLAKEVN